MSRAYNRGVSLTSSDAAMVDTIIRAQFDATGNSMSTTEAVRYALRLVVSVPIEPPAAAEPLTITVPLSGKWGRGHSMILDREVWDAGRASGWPSQFYLVFNEATCHSYVGTRCITGSMTRLARTIMDAKPGELVMYRNGPLDLRKSSLAKGPRSVMHKRIIGARRDSRNPQLQDS